MNLLIFGASITWGAWDKEGGWAQRIKSFADNKAISGNLENYTTVYCLGVDGDNTNKLLKRFEREVKARVGKEDKTFILIEIGINDSAYILSEDKHWVSPEKYKNNLVKLIKKSKQHGAGLIFVGLTPVDKRVDPIPWNKGYAYRLEFVKRYNEIIKEVCDENSVHFIEILSKFIDKDFSDLLIDGLHPSTKGHEIIFNEVKNYLLENKII